MLGHKLYQVAKQEGKQVVGCMRQKLDAFAKYGLFRAEDIYDGLDIRDDAACRKVVERVRPDVVVNCAGIVKPLAIDEVETIEVNSLFPHKLARLCSSLGARMIQVSTDCVFSGIRGNYSEDSVSDPLDLYGRSKLLGEITYGKHLTIRTSMIGRELGTRRNLIEWFLAQTGEVKGFTRAIFSGLTTRALSHVVLELAESKVSGLIHVAGKPMSKYDLLLQAKEAFGLRRISLVPDSSVVIDRSLAAPKLAALGAKVPPMEEMVHAMAAENEFYQRAGST